MSRITHIGNYSTGNSTFLNGISDLTFARSGDGRLLLLSGTHSGGGISSFTFPDISAPMVLADQAGYPTGWHLSTPEISLINLGGKVHALPVGLGGASGRVFGKNGDLGGVSKLGQANELLDNAVLLRQFENGDNTFTIAAKHGGAGFELYRSEDNGTQTLLETVSLPKIRNIQYAEIDDLCVVQSDGQAIIFSVSSLGNTIMSHAVDGSGKLSAGRSLGGELGLGFEGPSSIVSVEVHGRTFVVVGSSKSGSLSSLRVTPDGSLKPTDHTLDELSTRFQGCTALETVTVGHRNFVFAGGADGGVTMFTVLPDGSLLFLANIVDTADAMLADVSSLDVAVEDGRIILAVASETEPGISQFVIDPGDMGVSRYVDEKHGEGTSKADTLIAGSKTVSLTGGDGDDILIAGDRNMWLSGGSGADLFVATPFDGRIVIQDFEVGVDRIDMTMLGMIRSLGQVKIAPQDYGAKLFYGGASIVIHTSDGRMLTESDFSNDLFPNNHYRTVIPERTTIQGTEASETLAASAAGSTILADGGDDMILGSRTWDDISGGMGNDTIFGGDGADSILGEGGDDDIHGGLGDDTLVGGAGDDLLEGDDGDDIIQGNEGDDNISSGAGHDSVVGGADHDRIDGGSGDDTLRGGAGHDRIFGQDGDDVIFGQEGKDTILGGAGHDSINSGEGHDLLKGMAGDDNLNAGRGLDQVSGGAGNDTIFGAFGNDTLRGESGDDVINAGNGNDSVEGGLGDDTMYGLLGSDTINGSGGNDSLMGSMGNDRISGGTGDDTVMGQNGADFLHGGLGTDQVIGAEGNDTLYGVQGDDQLYGGTGNDLIAGGEGDDTIDGQRGVDTINGGGGNDLIMSGAGQSTIYGASGEDTIHGSNTNDHLMGGGSHDLIYGNGGADLILAGRGHDTVEAGAGSDTVDGSLGNDSISGHDGYDLLKGGSGIDTIHGEGGNDTIIGGRDADFLSGGSAADTFIFRPGDAGVGADGDRISDFESGLDKIDLSAFNLYGLIWLDQSDPSHPAHKLVARNDDGGTRLSIDLTGDHISDLEIYLEGIDQITLSDIIF